MHYTWLLTLVPLNGIEERISKLLPESILTAGNWGAIKIMRYGSVLLIKK